MMGKLMLDIKRIQISESEEEIPRLVNLLLGLSISRRCAMLTLLGLDVDSTIQWGIHNELQVRVPWISGQRIAVFSEAGHWSWEPLGVNETLTEGTMAGVAPQDFCIYLRIGRRVSWESDQIPLGESADAMFVGNSLRSLLVFMGLRGSVDSSWIQYLSRFPERLDEDPDALRVELSEADLG